MEPITHFLTGACLARTGFNRKTALATATMTLAAEAPDIDILGNLKDPVFGFAHHRGFTHSFLGLVLVQAVVVGLMYVSWRMRGHKVRDPDLPPRWGLLFLFAYLAGLTHILLDFTNNYGVRPFWPFWEKWYSWDIVFIVEPMILILLVAGLVLPAFFALINDEIGVRRKGPQGGLAALMALVGVVALFRWFGVVETGNFYATVLIDSSIPEADPEGRMRLQPKPEETPVTLAAKRSYLGRAYLDWAKYPITETEQVENPQAGYIVRFRDLRFDYPDQIRRGLLGASVELDRNLNVVRESFGSRSRRVSRGMD